MDEISFHEYKTILSDGTETSPVTCQSVCHKLHQLIPLIPKRIVNVKFVSYSFRDRKSEELEQECQAFLEILQRTRNIEVGEVKLPDDLEPAIRNLGESGHFGMLLKYQACSYQFNRNFIFFSAHMDSCSFVYSYTYTRRPKISHYLPPLAQLSCYVKQCFMSFGKIDCRQAHITQALAKANRACSKGKYRLKKLSIGFHDTRPKQWPGLINFYMDRLDEVTIVRGSPNYSWRGMILD